jgi:Transposase IS66 family
LSVGDENPARRNRVKHHRTHGLLDSYRPDVRMLPGAGITQGEQLPVAIGREAIMIGYTVLFTPATTPVAQLAKAHVDGRLDIGMERLATVMDEIFSLSISEGAISNMLARSREPLLAAAATIRATVTASPVVCSDETSARVSGKT